MEPRFMPKYEFGKFTDTSLLTYTIGETIRFTALVGDGWERSARRFESNMATVKSEFLANVDVSSGVKVDAALLRVDVCNEGAVLGVVEVA